MTFPTPLRLALAWLAVTVAFAAANPARAQQPAQSQIALASEIIEIKGSTALFDPLIPGVVEQTKATLLQMNPMLFKDLTAVSEQLRKEYAPRLSELKTEIVKIYAERFTEQELKDTLAFYKSPLGKKLLSEEPAFVNKSMSTAQEWAIKLNEEVLQRFRAEMKKRGHAL